MTAPYMSDAQFMVSGATGVASGQKAKNQIGKRNKSARILMVKPYLPRDHLLGGNGSPFRRLHATHAIAMK